MAVAEKKRRARTGEKRQIRIPLNIDRLPVKTRDKIQDLKAAGYTWREIEDKSEEFVEWDKLPKDVAALFPRRRIPHSNLQRWYDLRVEQVFAETAAQSERARALAMAMAKASHDGVDTAVVNLLRDEIFTLMEASDSGNKNKIMSASLSFLELLEQRRANDIKQQKVELDKKKVSIAERKLELTKAAVDKATNDAAKKLGKGHELTKDDINRIRERTFGLPPL